jgi:hypothetical protein
MGDYIFITDEKKYETLIKVSAKNIEKAKTKYAEKLWEIYDLEQKEFERNGEDSSFWGKYYSDKIFSRDRGWLHEFDKVKKLLKANLEKDFSSDIAEEIIYYIFNSDKDIDDLTDKARLDIAKVQVQNLLEDNFLRIYPLDEMRSIS